MTTLEQQCEEIRKRAEERSHELHLAWTVNPKYLEADCDVHKLLSIVAELRRPSDAKEIAEIQQVANDPSYTLDHDPTWDDINKVLHALAESQRECARLQAHLEEEQTNTAVVALGEQSERLVVSDASLAFLRQDLSREAAAREAAEEKADELQDEIARLSSPPEERRDIQERHAYALSQSFGYKTQVMCDVETLLQDLRRYENAHTILLGELNAAKERVVALEAKCALLAASEKQLEKHYQESHETITQLFQECRIHKQSIERLEGALRLVLPLAKGYTHSFPIGSNQEYCNMASAALAAADGQQHCEHRETHPGMLADQPCHYCDGTATVEANGGEAE